MKENSTAVNLRETWVSIKKNIHKKYMQIINFERAFTIF